MGKLCAAMVGLTLTLSSCGVFDRSPVPVSVSTLGGTIFEWAPGANPRHGAMTYVPWSLGPAKIKLWYGKLGAQKPHIETTINADGSFYFDALPVPDDGDFTQYSDSMDRCSGRLELSDRNVRHVHSFFGSEFGTENVDNIRYSVIAPQRIGIKDNSYNLIGGWLEYFDRPVSISGKIMCGLDDPFGYRRDYIIDIKAAKGWNWIIQDQIIQGRYREVTSRVGSISGLTWSSPMDIYLNPLSNNSTIETR